MSACSWWVGHKWGAWVLYLQKFALVGVKGVVEETRQQRRCKQCGKTQDEFVCSGRSPAHSTRWEGKP